VATHKIVADDSVKAPKEKGENKVRSPKVPNTTRVTSSRNSHNPFVLLGGYFKGAWQELRQVRWPNRKATWGLTLAVIAFVLFFGLLITGLDAAFKLLFQLILK